MQTTDQEDGTDRRHPGRGFTCVLKRRLNARQQATLQQLERFGWMLHFVRDDPAHPVATLLDPEDSAPALLLPDGSLIKDPPMHFRS
jgi:hypothetical protein